MPQSNPQTIILKKVDSTNNYAMALIHQGLATEGTSVFALKQTSGKGSMGKSWKSNAGENILLSVVTQTNGIPISRQFELSMAVALAGYDFLQGYCKNLISIKWPNDLFIGDKKAGGILIENIISGTNWQWAIIGIGLNINQDAFGHEMENATSLKRESGKSFETLPLATLLKDQIIQKIKKWKSGKSNDLVKQYHEHLFQLGKKVKLRNGNRTFETTIVGVTPQGELMTSDNQDRQWKTGEVEWVFGE